MEIRPVKFKGLPAYCLENEQLQLILTPYGAKIQSIRFLGREFLHQNSRSETYRRSAYADSFREGEFSGFDEMFPNISEGPYPDGPWKGVHLPDHGEVWSRDWQCRAEETGLRLAIAGIALPYRLEKHLSLTGNRINLRYRAENLSDHPLKCIWAAHPLFVLEDGLMLELPHCQQIVNVYGGRKYLGAYGQHWLWPAMDKGRDMRFLSAAHECSNKYYVSNPMEQNLSCLRYPSGTTVSLLAPVRAVPYLGIWTDEAGEDMACAALEPCTGAFDSLEKADEEKTVCVIPPKGEKDWSLQIEFTNQLPDVIAHEATV